MKKPVLKLLVLFAVCAITIYAAEKGLFFNGDRKDTANTEKYGLSADNTVSGGVINDDTVKVNTSFGLLADSSRSAGDKAINLVFPEGKTVQERILAPEGCTRIELPQGSFGEYLRNLPLKPDGSKVVYYNGEIKPNDVYAAVIDLDVGKRDLQQCADSVIRLRAEYLYGKGLYDQISFNFTNGFKADYSNWIKGNRINVGGNKVSWGSGRGSAGTGYNSFRSYLDMVFAYAGTLSLSKEMKNIPIDEMQPGDVFIKGASPGHCVIVLDMAFNKETGKKYYIIAQGYMPAQDMQILKNPANQDGDPWYAVSSDEEIVTPEWTFTKDQLYRFDD